MMARISQWILTFACGIGVAWMKFRMGTAAAADTVTRRTLRIAVEQGLPVVGGYLRDMVDTAIFSAGLMQTALGSLSLAAVMVTVLPCVLRMAIGYILMELTAFCADSDIAEGMHAAASLHLLFVGVTVLAAFWVLFCLGQMVAAVSRILGAV